MGLANYFRFIEHFIIITFPPDDAYSIGSMYKILVVVYHGIMHTVLNSQWYSRVCVFVCLEISASVSACMLWLCATAPFTHSFFTDLLDKMQISIYIYLYHMFINALVLNGDQTIWRITKNWRWTHFRSLSTYINLIAEHETLKNDK